MRYLEIDSFSSTGGGNDVKDVPFQIPAARGH